MNLIRLLKMRSQTICLPGMGSYLAWRTTLLAFTSSLCSWAGDPQESIRLSLGDAMRMASEQHISVLVANERVQQALARLSQAGSVLWPQITASASETRQTRNLKAQGISLPGSPSIVGPFNSFDGRARLTQTLLDVAAIQRLSAAKAGKSLSVGEVRKARQDAMALVATLYMDAKRAVESIGLAQALLDRDRERFRLAKKRLELGTGSALEVLQSEAAFADSRRKWQISTSEAVERRLDLTPAIGLSRGQAIIFVEDPSFPKNSFPPEAVALAGIGEHPDLAVARQTLDQNKAEHHAESAGLLPKISATGDYGVSGSEPSRSDKTYSFGIQASVPIFEGGLQIARMKEAESRVRESQARLNDTQQHVEAAVLSARESISKATMFLQAAEAGVAVASQQSAVAQQRLQSGMGSDLELVDARAQLALADDQRKEAVATCQLAQVNLAHAMGNMETLLKKNQKP